MQIKEQENRVLGVIGSVRARCPEDTLNREVSPINTFDQAYNLIYQMASERRICNTEGIMIASAAGARSQGSTFASIRLNKYFPTNTKKAQQNLERLLELTEQSQGIVIGSPVYFGDRSSQVESFFSYLAKQKELPLTGKVVGLVSVGAKRNGGQETTNILSLQDCLRMGANVLGNGSPTSQYGGTAIAGDIGSILDDNFGLQTSFGTGKRVALMSAVSNQSKPSTAEPRILIIYTVSPDKKVASWMEKALPSGVQFKEIFLDHFSINRCLGCSPCPNAQTKDKDFPCIQEDDMVGLRSEMLSADGILMVNVVRGGQDLNHYQLFAERTRFIRRNHFEIANLPTGVIQFSDLPEEPNFSVRATNLLLRHNTLIVGPGYSSKIFKGELWPAHEKLTAYLAHYKTQVENYMGAYRRLRDQDVYVAVGYEQK